MELCIININFLLTITENKSQRSSMTPERSSVSKESSDPHLFLQSKPWPWSMLKKVLGYLSRGYGDSINSDFSFQRVDIFWCKFSWDLVFVSFWLTWLLTSEYALSCPQIWKHRHLEKCPIISFETRLSKFYWEYSYFPKCVICFLHLSTNYVIMSIWRNLHLEDGSSICH